MASISLSIIIPVYNTEKYLHDCISSALAINIKDKEIIIVNDGSSDGSERIILEFKRKNKCIRYISQKNKGPGGARNTALDVARGEYVYFLDSDDTVIPDALVKVLKLAEKENIDIMHFDASYCVDGVHNFENYKKKHSLEHYYITAFNEEVIVVNSQCMIMNSKNKFFKPTVWWYLFKREALEKNHIRFEEKIIHEDDLFVNLAILNAKRMKYVPIQTYLRRYRPGSLMVALDKNRSISGLLKVCEKLYDYYENNNLYSEEKRFLERLIRFEYEKAIIVAKEIKNQRPRQLRLVFSEMATKKKIFSSLKDKIYLFFGRVF